VFPGLALLARALLTTLAWAGPLSYSGSEFPVEVAENRNRRGEEYLLKFPSPLKSPFAANNTVWGHLLLPEGKGPFPCILVLPVMAAPNLWIEERFIRRFLRDGFAVLWIEMPYQFHRRPHPSVASGQGFLARTPSRLAFNFRQAALDARRALAWLRRHPDIDPKRIGLFGVSLGAFVGASVYSADPSPRYAVFLMGGADFPSLVAESSMTGPALRRMGLDPASLREAWKGLDPLDYTQANAGKKLLLFNVRSDRVVPRPNALKLKEAFPSSRQVWLPFGHYSAILHLIWIPRHVSKHFRLNL